MKMRAEKAECAGFGSDEMRTICSSALFADCSPSEIARLLAAFDMRRMVCGQGMVVADESSVATRMGLVLSGYLHVYDLGFRGTRHLVKIVRPGEFIGTTLLGGTEKTHPAFVTAFGACVLATFSLSAVEKVLEKGSGVVYNNIAAIVREELQSSWRKIAILSCSDVSNRVMLTLQDVSRREKSKTFAIGSTEFEFANYLGISRPALASTLRSLVKAGRFAYKKNVFKLP